MLPPNFKIVDISLELDPKNFAMRTPAGFKKDMQFAMEVIKEHDAPGGAGQIVRGVHMRLHAGSHVDAPEHNVRDSRSEMRTASPRRFRQNLATMIGHAQSQRKSARSTQEDDCHDQRK